MGDTIQIPTTPRPVYENERTLRAEHKIAEWLRKKWEYPHMHKLPRSYFIDYAMGTGRLCDRYVEIRTRNMRWDAFDDKYISVSKYMHGMALSGATNAPVYLALATMGDKRLGVWEMMPYEENTTGFYTSIDGRHPKTATDRGDPADVEPVLHIPNHQFTMLI